MEKCKSESTLHWNEEEEKGDWGCWCTKPAFCQVLREERGQVGKFLKLCRALTPLGGSTHPPIPKLKGPGSLAQVGLAVSE